MDICNLPGGRGKTTYLIYRSHITGFHILCITQNAKKEIIEMAKQLEISIPEPITVDNYISDYLYTSTKKIPDNLLVDEGLYILGDLLRTNIDTVTFSERSKEFKE